MTATKRAIQLLAIACLSGTLTLTACSESASRRQSDSNRQTAALTACRDSVRQQLKTTTATFTGEHGVPTNYGFKFTGSVVAQSGPGAGTTNHYVCAANEKDGSWQTDGISVSAS